MVENAKQHNATAVKDGDPVTISRSKSTDRKFSTSVRTKSNWNSTAEDD